MALDRDELKKLLKEKGVKSLDDFNAFMREVSKEVVETLLDGELTDHLGYEKHDQKTKSADNARNGFTPKTVKSKFGEIDLDVPRDRKSDFEPEIVKKRQKDISGLEEKIISMYAKGMTTRDIQAHIKDLYGYEISPETVSSITDKVMERAREWQGRPLESVYALIYLEEFSEKWDKRYPHISASWRNNWDEIVTFFKYPPEIRTMVYTTNPIESLNRKIKKVAKNNSIFPNDQALIKQVYLAVEEAAKKWTFRHRDWAMIYSQLMIYFGDRLGERA